MNCTIFQTSLSYKVRWIAASALLFAILQEFPDDIKIECSKQPTILYHKVFTDFLIKVSTRKKMALIEVKNPRISRNLCIRPRETAQVLREAQIILLQRKVHHYS